MKPIPPLLGAACVSFAVRRLWRQPPGRRRRSPIVYQLMVFVMAIFVGYYVVWSVTPRCIPWPASVTNRSPR